MNTLTEAEQYAAEAAATARSLGNDYACADDARTMSTAEVIAYMREQRERARDAFQARFDAPPVPRQVSARQALHTGNWGGFFDSCCQPF